MRYRPPKSVQHPWIKPASSLLLLLLLPAFLLKAEPADTMRFNALLHAGDSVYSQKQSYFTFLGSLRYFDSAKIIAEREGDPGMLAQATFARGRVYDAWNKEPRKTIALFSEATGLFRSAGNERRYFYAKHLLAHAYDKIRDSANTARVLLELYDELAMKDTATRHSLNFIPEMALIATEVHAYPLAERILSGLYRREWIRNDPETYNYLDHYYLTRSRLDVLWKKNVRSPFPDSLEKAYLQLMPLFDRMYYADQLGALYAAMGNFKEAYRYRSICQILQSKLFEGNDFEQMQRALTASEAAGARRELAYETAISTVRAYVNAALGLLAALIALLSIYLYRRNKKYRAQSVHLRELNAALDTQIEKVELLNKEIQHRIKNNLYTIYSLLHMQQDSTDNEEVIAHLEAARMRVESVAALHDHLLNGSASVDFGTYIKTLVNKVVACQSHRRNVVTHIGAEPVSLPLNTCFALSLILNEWITNSIKYATPAAAVLNLEVRITNTDTAVCIDYRDDGVQEPAASAGDGLGTEIIRLLTTQIRARLDVSADHPYHYNLCIPNGQ